MGGTGSGWRAWFSAWRSGSGTSGWQADSARASTCVVQRGWRNTELKFAGSVTQSRMRTFRPDHLLVPYTRTMMATLLFRPEPRLVGMVGLGGGSQAKFCHRWLPRTRVEAVESEAGVIAMRRKFRIPDDDARLQVFHDDGARFLRERRGRYDILLVDAYDPHGIPEALSTQRWYDDCRDALAPGGVLATNLFCADAARHVERLRRSFGPQCVLALKEPRMSNHVAFAWADDTLAGAAFDANARLAALPPALRRELADEFARVAAALRERR